VYVICACLVFLSASDLLVNCFVRNSSQADNCVTIQTQRTQISGKDSNGTKHSGEPPEDCRKKRPKHVGVLYLQTRF
jgi:hypothetical protein